MASSERKRESGSKITASPTQLRQEHEARTGCRENMRQFGFVCRKSSPTTGEPVLFDKLEGNHWGWRIRRTYKKQWRIVRYTASVVARYEHERKVDSPLFPGPIAAAMWLAVEKENGSIRITEG